MKITITRAGLTPTQLNVEIIAKNNLGERPVAFILPGGPGASLKGYQKYTCLSEVVDLVFHDPRGCGESDRGDVSTYTMNNYIDDVDAIRAALSLDKIILIGKSYGAMCALGYALRYPQALQKLVLSAGAPSYHFLARAKENILRVGTPEQIAICEKIWKGGIESRAEMKRYFELTNPLYSVKARTQPEGFDPQKKSEQFSHDVLNAGFASEFGQFDFDEDLQRISCPTLVLVGCEDWITDPYYSVLMAEKIPDSQLKIFDNASHAMESDVTEEYFHTIIEFINAV